MLQTVSIFQNNTKLHNEIPEENFMTYIVILIFQKQENT